MENISRGPNFGDFVTILTEGVMQDKTIARLQSTRVQTPLSIKFNVLLLRESLSKDSQNNPCATLKRRGSWVISVGFIGTGYPGTGTPLTFFHEQYF
jgi:hypothetical protein